MFFKFLPLTFRCCCDLIVTAVPEKSKSIGVGDRVLEINGIKASDFQNEKKANDLFDVLTLSVVPADDGEEDEEEEGDDDGETDEVRRRQ